MKNLLAVCVCLLHLYALAGGQAPGDEDSRCLQRTATIRPPTYPPSIMPLMESLHYLELLGDNGVWRTTGRNRWVTGLGGVCQQEVEGCSFNSGLAGTNNYIFTQYISTTGAQEIMVNVSSTFQPCFGRGGNCGPDYNQFHVLVYESDEHDREESMDPSNYRSLGQVNIPSGSAIFVPRTRIFSFVPQRRGFYIGLLENGTCATVSRLVAYAFRCPARTLGLVEHNNVFSPPREGNRNSITIGQCSEHSSQQDGSVTEPICECGPMGEWVPGPDCECDPGHRHMTVDGPATCIPCDAGFYKSTFSNMDVCVPCPSNSDSAEGSSMCGCSPGFFRAPDEGVEMGCTGPPSAPVNLMVVGDITNTTVSIAWNPPAENGGRSDTKYNVFYQLSDSLFLGFMEGSQGVVGLTATVQGLLPVREYVLRVVAENGVSDQAESTDGRVAEIRATTTEGVPNIITVFARRRGSTFTWQPPTVTNGQLTGFDFRLFREDEDDDDTIIELEDLDFCYGPIPDDIPEGSGDVYAQVRARTAVGPGPWSEAILYIGTNECNVDNGGCDHICTNTQGSVQCICNSGYTLNSDGRSCDDVNECTEGTHNCEQECTNTEGSFQCSCGSGYRLSSNRRNCVDINECTEGTHNCEQVCTNTEGSFQCSCGSGYRLSSNRRSCNDINECTEGTHNCDQECTNTQGSFQCSCDSGYTLNGDGRSCDDVNECTEGTHNCDQECTNTEGSFQCSCRSGYRLSSNRRSCNDINECTEGTHNCDQECTNTEGSFRCSCRSGFTLASDGRTCNEDTTPPTTCATGCGGTLRGDSGCFNSPGWPESYPINIDCEWNIELASTDRVIRFTYDDSEYGIAGNTPCPRDYVEIFDGLADEGAPSLGRSCFRETPPPVVTSTSQSTVRFHAGPSHNPSRRGFRLTYEVVNG